MISHTSISTVASIIQLSVAPVFLLAGIAGILNVLAARLARIVDRARSLEMDVPTADAEVQRAEIRELAILDRRMTMCHWAIGLCTFAALLVCVVVMVLFVAVLSALNFAVPVSLLFIGAMVSVTLGLLLFLGEVTIATRWVRVSEQFVLKGKPLYDR
ncbi:MAG TPA: DUF2721 domain-containing protein [Allosphingosinicella sp.]|uniref:DUF2721 domain-containing protein n=1 Tax=Allosphingosinicella sp. TaxID=2823234 RepID=UPI002EDAEB6B